MFKAMMLGSLSQSRRHSRLEMELTLLQLMHSGLKLKQLVEEVVVALFLVVVLVAALQLLEHRY